MFTGKLFTNFAASRNRNRSRATPNIAVNYKTATNFMNMFDTERDVTNVQGSFVYRKFEPFEQIDEGLIYTPKWCFDDFGDPLEDWKTIDNVPRYVQITWNSDSNAEIIPVDLTDLTQGENIFFHTDLLDSYSQLLTDEVFEIRRQDEKISDNSSVASKLDYLLSQSASNKFTEGVESQINANSSKIPVINPSTNRPVQNVDIQLVEQPPDVIIQSSVATQIIDGSLKSSILSNEYEKIKSQSRQISAKYDGNERKLSTFTSIMTNPEQTNRCFDVSDATKSLFSTQFELIGYAISKYRVENSGTDTYIYTRVCQQRLFEDPYVAYGQTYRYEIRPIYAKIIENKNKIFVTVSNESSFIVIECVEERIPEPPANLSFEYILDNRIEVSWSRPNSFVEDKGKIWETNDIKGYQIFVRNSLRESYNLVKYFTFNNTTPQSYRMYSKEFIPDDYVLSSEDPIAPKTNYWGAPIYNEPNRYILSIRPNQDYFFTMCSIDAHGNSSNYGTQFKIRRNNVTGEVDVKLLCGKGAPKQYPNVYIPGKLVNSAMTVSSYEYMDVYFNPDTKLSVPNKNEEASSLQLFELETQAEKNIKITIDTNSN